MKKILMAVIVIMLITGCGKMKTQDELTPRMKVEEYLQSFQQREDSILEDLEEWIGKENMDESYKKEYQGLLERQYQNLSYEIIREEESEDTAQVEVEIEVLDYKKSMQSSRDYFNEHQEEFLEERIPEEEIESRKEFIEYTLKNLDQVEDKTKYTINFDLVKEEDEWKIESISSEDFQKLYGLY